MKRTKLSSRVLRSLILRVGAVVLCATALGWWYLHRTLERSTVQNISTATRERAERESVIFKLARENQEFLKAEVIKAHARGTDPAKVARFDALLTRYPDGTIRNRKDRFDGRVNAGVFIPSGHPITPAFKSLVITLAELAETYGPSFRTNFQDTYFTLPQNVMVIYWPESPNWVLEMNKDFDMTREEYMWVTSKENNPSRTTVWTGLFFDKVSATWMTAGETPIYSGDFHLANVGNDVMLSELVKRTESPNDPEGVYSLILRTDGRVVAHPDKQEDLRASEGRYEAQSDPYLKELYEQIMKSTGVARHPSTGDILVHARVHGPDWLLVTVYPNWQIFTHTFRGVGFVIGLALLSLILEMLFFYLVLEREVNRPLAQLSKAAQALREGRRPTLNFSERTDELGQFAATFQLMSDSITERDRALQEHASSLEAKVRERTKELQERKGASIQQAKMASLGEMAGGMAHEINNPLATIALIVHHSLELLSDPKPNVEALRQNLERMGKTSERIAKIVKGLRTFSRSAGGDPMQKASLEAILQDTLSLCGEKLKNSGVDLRVVEEPAVQVHCRATEISQVILNLLNNALDAVGAVEDKWIELRTVITPENLVQVRVTDNGPAIPPEIRAKLGQPFFTTKEVGKGTGLGLSISKGIAESNGGRLFLDITVPHTCFVLELPIGSSVHAGLL